jgi:hypothetical protein
MSSIQLSSMPIIQPPALQAFSSQDSKRSLHIVTASYNFAGDTGVPLSLGSFVIQNGSEYTIDPTAFGNAGLGSFKALGFTAQFQLAPGKDETSDNDGNLFIYSQSTQQFITISPPFQPTGTLSSVRSVCGMIPIIAHGSGKIIIVKCPNLAGGIWGNIALSLYDFAVPPFITSGNGQGIAV